jgi:sorbitol/mannitol transport system substrate-binding protein
MAESAPAVRLLQEDYPPFYNLRRTLPLFTERTGIRVEVTYLVLEPFWEQQRISFESDTPPFDVMGCDEIVLLQHARRGQVAPLDDFVSRDHYDLADFTPAVIEAASFRGRLYGIPYTQMSNVLIYRRDLVDRYSLAVPQTMDELYAAAVAARRAALAEGRDDLYGIASRGRAGCGHNFWTIGSTFMPAWGGRWVAADGRPDVNNPENVAALDFYARLLRDAGPPDSPSMTFFDNARFFGQGQAVFFIDTLTEASMLIDEGVAVADQIGTALIPAGPRGRRHPGLYAPPFAIPARTPNLDAAWELVKFLADRAQVISDSLHGGFIEVARQSALDSPELAGRFRAELLQTVRDTRPHARGERPLPAQGLAVGDVIGEESERVLRGEQSAQQALDGAQQRILALGDLDIRPGERVGGGR